MLLGASNLTMGLGRVYRTVRAAWPEPLDLLLALGHGRSYGAPSQVLGRTLPGIAGCGLWNDLARRSPLPTVALLTDLGNDIVYGYSVDTIAGWVEQCLDRLAGMCERIVVTELPLESARSLSPLQFRLFRSLFFPHSTVSQAEATAAATALNERLPQWSTRYRLQLLAPRAAWFGSDGIHFRWRARGLAWQSYLAPLVGSGAGPAAYGPSWRWWSYLASRRPLERTWCGRAWQSAQPAVQLRDGTAVSFY